MPCSSVLQGGPEK